MRYLIGMFALVLALGVSVSAQAEVQNVKVGGDIQIRGITRSNYNLVDKVLDASWYDSAVRLQISADLSNDVGAVVRLINERDWNATAGGDGTGKEDIALDLGYITLDNMFGYPVKATLGRQDILFGEGFLIGDGFNGVSNSNLYYGSTESIRTAFDALRVTYSAAPYTVDLFTAKIHEGFASSLNGDTNLSGVNVNYAYLDIATFDLGYFVKLDGNTGSTKDNNTKALSLRGEGEIPSIPGLTVKGEYVWETGKVITSSNTQDRDANGWYLGAEYALQDNTYQPYFGATYVFLSGEDTTTNDREQFDALYSDYQDFGTIASLKGLNDTNLKAWKLTAGLKPTEALSLDIAYAILNKDETAATIDDHIANELDATLTYDYTEDVQFGLSAAWFDSGQYYTDTYGATYDKTATQVVGSVKVSF
ncbi:MAG: alginate export family protein [Nitrospirae bacterium]|nr:alginate export family protein [Nitrospirota bacterium]